MLDMYRALTAKGKAQKKRPPKGDLISFEFQALS
jgi:hypothetical protein